ncbi:GDSL-type esterase/lipase family protein [Marinilactibacillus psychrotolerans]|uniref:GDSL-type esterase/lipase family protein n=1 Tax=Marinilactibacillus psychrotolerans TaxID=191770 RepID=A0ABW8UIC3_9LACT|nr:GDSL-type esterase/lipase family protein [Marinilactibacillus psychrotolerans]GEQ33439.1 lipase [Marinilactibacillus psychrotolerans]
MKYFKVFVSSFLIIMLSALIGYLLLNTFISNNSTQGNKLNENMNKKESTRVALDIVAIGDSLTEGVGDSTKRGGYVPLVAEQLRSNPMVSSVETQNYGHAGDTTKQLLALLEEEETVQSALSQADIITLTIGGNDIVNNLDKVGLNGSLKDFESTIQSYEKNVNIIFSTLKELNSEAIIYIYGLYNPYHYYFNEFSQLQKVFDTWNSRTKQLAEDTENVNFVEIDSRFNPAEFSSEPENSSETVEDVSELEDENHPYLYKEDLFHPNDRGYQIMADTLYDLMETDLKNQTIK